MSPDEFRRLGHELIDWIADFRGRAETMPVMSNVEPGWVRQQFENEPPASPVGLARITRELDTRVVPGLSHFNHPSFFAFFPGNVNISSVLADIVSTGLGVNGITWQACPALTEVEEVMMDWLRQMVGLPEDFRGVIQDTASTGNLVALLCARERASDYAMLREGLPGVAQPLTVYVSEDSHSSVEKAALLAGFGRQWVRKIPTTADHELDFDALAAAVQSDVEAGRKPAAFVAAAGTTATCAFDPIAKMADLASRTGAWLHVDAAMAGSGMICPELRPLWQGIERADSLLFNPHKWLGAAVDCSAFYVRDPQSLTRVMSTNPSYLVSNSDGAVTQYRDWGIPLGRRFRALKIWFLLLSEGVEGLQTRVRRDLAHAQWFQEQVQSNPEWEIMAPVRLQTVCVRHVLPGLTPEQLDEHNEAWARSINESGVAYLTTTLLHGRRVVRVSIGSQTTERRHLQALWSRMQEAAHSAD